MNRAVAVGRAVPRSGRGLGLLLSVGGVLLLSPDALLIRLIEESPWTILFWRGALSAATLTVLIAGVGRGSTAAWFRAIGRVGILAGAFHALGSTLFVHSITQTSAANTLVIVSTGPLFAALLSRVFLRETVPRRTWIAIFAVIGAVAIVFSGSLGSPSVVGDLAAVGGALAVAAVFTAIRGARAVNMVPAMVIGAGLTAVAAFAIGARFPSGPATGLLLLQGAFLIPAAAGLLATAPRHLPAPEVSLIVRLEMVLGPLWVWLVLEEAPTANALLGGALVLATLAAHTYLSIRDRERTRAAELLL